MNDTVITVNGKTWIVPANKTQGLIAWLSSNAVDASESRSQLREVIGNSHNDPRQLILEGV